MYPSKNLWIYLVGKNSSGTTIRNLIFHFIFKLKIAYKKQIQIISLFTLLHFIVLKLPFFWPTTKMHNLFLVDYQWVNVIKGKIVYSQVKDRVLIRKLKPVKVVILQPSIFALKRVRSILAFWLLPNYIDFFQFAVNLIYRTIKVPAKFIHCKESLLLQYSARFNRKCPSMHRYKFIR